MAVKPVVQKIVGATTPVQLDVDAESDYAMGRSLLISTSAPLHWGGDNTVRNAADTGVVRGALLPAGVYPFNNLSPTDHLFVIAPAGQSVTVEILQVGV
jgi:hypothetical protein